MALGRSIMRNDSECFSSHDSFELNLKEPLQIVIEEVEDEAEKIQ